MANKQYGLILPKKQQQTTAPILGNVFGDDNASDEDDGTDWIRKALKAESEKNRTKKQTKLNMQKALDEDPTIYQYDEVYDDLERGKSQLDGVGKQKEKKSKYIQKLLKTAEQRKKEQEHRIERMVQKEREAEGDMYVDKESFVTSAYRAKLEEFKKMEEEEAKMNRLEAIGDVTKQQDMSGFYRHLYEQTVDYKGETCEDANNPKEENTEQEEQRKKKRTLMNNASNEENPSTNKRANKMEKETTVRLKKSRQYRQRDIETYESDSEIENMEEKSQTNVSLVDKKTDGTEVQKPKEKELDVKDMIENIVDTKNEDVNIKKVEISRHNVSPENEKTEIKEKPIKQKDRTSIWEKRTIGPVFEAALQRYRARKIKRMTAVD